YIIHMDRLRRLSVLYTFLYLFFCFNDQAPTEIYTLSLHDALPICQRGDRHPQLDHENGPHGAVRHLDEEERRAPDRGDGGEQEEDRKSTRLNSSHLGISYAVFCLKKKNINMIASTQSNLA